MSNLTTPRIQVSLPLHWLGKYYLKLFGWKVESEVPPDRKLLCLITPHTTNWDFVMLHALALHYKVPIYFIAKHTMFRWPFGWFVRRVGGIPVNRKSTVNFVDQVVNAFNEREELVLGIAPEGTRSRTDFWKTGFYHIALGAKVRIGCTFVDYGRKVTGFGPIITPSGDIEADMAKFREFYSQVTPRRPENKSEIVLDKRVEHDPPKE